MLRTIIKQLSSYDNCVVFNQVTKRYAGHSKWQNIKHIKGAKDAERSLIFAKLARLMKVAVIGCYKSLFIFIFYCAEKNLQRVVVQ